MIVLVLLGVAVMLLWNALLPSIFGLARINFWQALGLLVLSKILFGNIGGKMMMGGEMRHGGRRHFRERWMNMSPEEREAWVKKIHSHRFDHRQFHGHNEPNREA